LVTNATNVAAVVDAFLALGLLLHQLQATGHEVIARRRGCSSESSDGREENEGGLHFCESIVRISILRELRQDEDGF